MDRCTFMSKVSGIGINIDIEFLSVWIQNPFELINWIIKPQSLYNTFSDDSRVNLRVLLRHSIMSKY